MTNFRIYDRSQRLLLPPDHQGLMQRLDDCVGTPATLLADAGYAGEQAERVYDFRLAKLATP